MGLDHTAQADAAAARGKAFGNGLPDSRGRKAASCLIALNSSPVAYAPATWSDNRTTIDLSGFDDARYVRVKLGPDAVLGGWLMLTEVEFDVTPAAPPIPAGTVILIR